VDGRHAGGAGRARRRALLRNRPLPAAAGRRPRLPAAPAAKQVQAQEHQLRPCHGPRLRLRPGAARPGRAADAPAGRLLAGGDGLAGGHLSLLRHGLEARPRQLPARGGGDAQAAPHRPQRPAARRRLPEPADAGPPPAARLRQRQPDGAARLDDVGAVLGAAAPLRAAGRPAGRARRRPCCGCWARAWCGCSARVGPGGRPTTPSCSASTTT